MLLLDISDATTGQAYLFLYIIVAAIVGTGTIIYWLTKIFAWIINRFDKE